MVHPLEHDGRQREYFTQSGRAAQVGYRAAVRALCGSLPTWAQPKAAEYQRYLANTTMTV